MFMDTQQPSTSVENNQPPENKNKASKTWLIIGAIVLLLAVGYLWSRSSQQGDNPKTSPSETVLLPSTAVAPEQKVAQLSGAEQSSLSKKLSSLFEDIKKYTDKTTQEDKDKDNLQIASIQHSLGSYQEALASLGKISAEYKNRARVNLNYALIYKDMGDLAKAAEYAKKALDADQDNQQIWVVYLETEQNLNNGERDAKYHEALEKTKNHENVLVSYAKFLELLGNKEVAIEQYKKAGEINQTRKAEFDAEIARLEGK